MKLRIVVLICGVLLGLLMASVSVASNHNLFASLHIILSGPWGVVTLLDLGVGLLFVATCINWSSHGQFMQVCGLLPY